MFVLLAILFSLIALFCHVVVLINAFMDVWWKGLLGLLCGLYLLYWAIVEYKSTAKWSLLALWLISAVCAGFFNNLAGWVHWYR